MPTVREVEQALSALAPKELAQSWDNVGLLVGQPDWEVRRILVALDITEDVIAEAEREGAEVIVAHHPIMNCAWRPVQTIRGDDIQGRKLIRLIAGGIAAICMHTNLDAASGGVNDALAAALGLEQVELLGEGEGIARQGLLPKEMQPPDFLAHVKNALHANGLRYVGGERPIRRVAVGGGACGGYFRTAAEKGCDAFVTADVKYDQFLDARELGLTLLDAGHFPTEDVVCPRLVDNLSRAFPGLSIQRAASHREVIRYYL